MSDPKIGKSDNSSSVKYSNKSGGAYADMKDVISSERQHWGGGTDTSKGCGSDKSYRNDKDQKGPKK
jgi:hypothetical protein